MNTLKIIISSAITGGIIAVIHAVLKALKTRDNKTKPHHNAEEFADVFNAYDYETFTKVCKDNASRYMSSKERVSKAVLILEGNGKGLVVPVIYYKTSDEKVMRYDMGKELAINISDIPEEVIDAINSEKKGYVLTHL